ncbi:hypothetical protein SDC9_12875 [bioreactor metagenome]|uniref:Uncharacterized protein n=1 Tax=bioreactor metagenome TaxID=1076179 RepID=A0A644TJK4_9ZZZZ|nr:hypothetical protein [Acidaminococcaceae bacterium]
MRTAFICYRGFQVLNCINFVYNNIRGTAGSSDIYIVDEFFDDKDIAERLRKTAIFNKVILVKDIPDRSLSFNRHFGQVLPKKYLQYRLGLKKEPISDYKQLVTCGWNKLFIRYAEFLKGKDIKIIFLDDGIVSYVGNMRDNEYPGLINKKIKPFFGKGAHSIKIDELYLNNIAQNQSSMVDHVRELPKLVNAKKEFKELLNYVFGYNEKCLNTKYVFLDQFTNNDINMEKVISKAALWGKIAAFVPKGELLVRLHPHDTGTMDLPGVFFDKKRSLWELVCINEVNDKNVLIGYCSTALITPKFIFDEEPIIICLYKLVEFRNKEKAQEIDNVFMQLRESYRRKERVIIPGNITELESVLEKISLLK